jgi:hypothetical protein
MTWSSLVAHVRSIEQCDEREARRQIGNAIEYGKLFPRWTDRPLIPPIPGTKISWAPITSTAILPDDAPPRDASYWLECEIDPTDPDQIREPPLYDPGTVDRRTAKRLDKKRRYRRPTFDRYQVLRLWPIAKVAPPEDEKREAPSVFRDDTNVQYQHRLSNFHQTNNRYPTRDEDEEWGREHHVSRTRVRGLRREFLPDEIKKGGAPKKENLAKNNLAAKLPS